MKFSRLIIVYVLFVMLLVGQLYGAGGVLPGDGSEATPYQIEDYADFLVFTDPANSGTYWAEDVYTDLNTNLDLSSAGTYTTCLIGPSEASSYFGIFNGNSHIISNATINGGSHLGLFGFIGVGAEVHNLGLEAFSITSSGSRVGVLCGTNNGLVSECYSANSSISGTDNLGGLCGYNYNSTIVKSYALNVDVTGRNNIGGLCGYNHHYGNLENCYAVGRIIGSSPVGGLCGYLHDHAKITNCYSASIVTGGDSTGGLVGNVNYYYELTNNYFYDYGGRNNDQGEPLDIVQLQDASYFPGFDFTGNSDDGLNDIWSITSGHFPKLYYQTDDGASRSQIIAVTTLSGSGTSNDPFLISDYDDLMEFRNNTGLRNGYFELTADIDLLGLGISEAFIDQTFVGLLDGGGYTIRNFSITGSSRLGFFRTIDGTVKKFGFDAVNITGTSNTAGVLCGTNYFGLISECFVTNSEVNAQDNTGGLCGHNYYGNITNSYALNVNIIGEDNVGGLCGYSQLYSNIENCYASGTITGETYVGGLCGYLHNNSNINICYSAAIVNGSNSAGGLLGGDNYYCSVSNSYYYGYGGRNNNYGMPLDIDQLQNDASFIGFDFVGNTDDGSNDTWDIASGYFPKLSYQTDDGTNSSIILTATTLTGEGTYSSPYLISNYDDMLEFRNNAALRNGCFKLTADIDLLGLEITEAFVNQTFAGLFDGDWHIISNFIITGSSNLGFFRTVDGTVKKLGFDAVNITGTSSTAGILCARNNYGLISECFVTNSTIYGYDTIGGLCGYNYNGSITKSYALNIDVNGRNNVGGLCGYSHYYSNIENCYAVGNINGSSSVGGLCGYLHNNSNIINSYSTAIVNGSSNIGVLVGSVEYNCTLSYIYSYAYGGRNNNYGVLLDISQLQDSEYFPGFDFVGNSEDGSNDIWNITSGYFPRLSYQVDSGADSSYLLATTTLSGSGTFASPYLISGYDDMLEFRNNASLRSGCFKLTADIDMQNLTIDEAFIDQPFIGLFDGDGHAISNFTISGGNNLGLFSRNDGTIIDLGIESATISGAGNNVGILCATNYYGLISECYVSNSNISGTDSVGGLCGYNYNSNINKSFTYSVSVTGRNNVGGLCGYNHYYSTIENCYAIGTVNGTNRIGGLCGYLHNNSNLINCYSSATLSGSTNIGGLTGIAEYYYTVVHSYWDIETDGIDGNVSGDTLHGAIGKTTAELQTVDTFEGWDFTDDGESAVWFMFAGEYPRLRWEVSLVPDVVNIPQAEAEDAVRAKRLLLDTVEHEYSFTIVSGNIISQSLTAGEYVLRHTPIDLVVSDGPEMAIVPDVVDTAQAEAETSITNVKLVVGEITHAYDFDIPTGNIISQSIDAGEIIIINTEIDLVVSDGPEMTTVPDIVYMTEEDAVLELMTAKLNIGTITHQYDFTVPSGQVISQSLAAGESAIITTEVDIVVSDGPEMVGVPTLYNLNLTEAIGIIEGAGLTVGEITTSNSFTVAKGNVIGQSIASGGTTVIGSAVDLAISDGPQIVTVPETVGLDQLDAEAAIVSADLTVGSIIEHYSSTVNAGLVISQSVPADEDALIGSLVSLVISKGPKTTTVPDIVGLPQSHAEALIEAADMIVGTITTENSLTVPAGNVISQSLTTGDSVIVDTAIDLVISDGPEMVAVPELVNSSVTDAETALTSIGLIVGTKTYEYNMTIAAGNIISQSVTAGETIEINSAVDLVISNGPIMVRVPYLRNKTQTEAEAALLDSGLEIGNVTSGTSYVVAPGLVISHTAATGESVAMGSTVDLVISSGSEEVNIETFANMATYWMTSECNTQAECLDVDFNYDNSIDMTDLTLLSEFWLSPFGIFTDTVIAEYFEGLNNLIDLEAFEENNWTLDSSENYQGVNSARSAVIGDGQQSIAELRINTTGFDTISFACKVSSEQDYDYLKFYIDGKRQDMFSGEIDWMVYSYTVLPGEHSFRWIYEKDETISEGDDTAWIDSIIISQNEDVE